MSETEFKYINKVADNKTAGGGPVEAGRAEGELPKRQTGEAKTRDGASNLGYWWNAESLRNVSLL